MAGFIFGDFSEQETKTLFGNENQSLKINEPEFPWSTDDCLTTTIEFGFDVPTIKSPTSGIAVSYSNYPTCNGNSSHQESTSSAMTSPPYSSKSSSIENVKITKQSSTHNRRDSEKKLKKKRPPNYYRQEYQQMLEPSTLQQMNGQKNEFSTEQIGEEDNEKNFNLLSTNDSRYKSCHEWVHSTIQHQNNNHQENYSSKQSIDDDEIESDERDTTTDTDNDNEFISNSSTYPVDIQENIPKKFSSNQQLINQFNNDLNIYSTSVASGASIETLKPSTSPIKQNDFHRTKPSSWADLFRNQSTNNNQIQPQQENLPIEKQIQNEKPLSTQQYSTQRNNSNHFYSRPNYHVYNSNGGESKSLEDYFTKCEIRPSAMAIKPRGLQNKINYSYINATLQSLLACPSFFNVMKYIPLTEDPIDHYVPSIKAFHFFVNQFDKMDRSKSMNHKDIICGEPFDPIDILNEISRLRQIPLETVQNKQEDPHELLLMFLNELHEEICSVLDQTSMKKESSSNEFIDEKSEDWLQVGKRNRTHFLRTNELRKSLIAEIFAGKFRSTLPNSGNQKSVVYEPFFTLSLDIKDSKINSLDEALTRFCEQTIHSDSNENKSRQTNLTQKNLLIEQLPSILIIHLKYFLTDENDGMKKLNKTINYSVNLTIPKSILTESAKKQSDRYKLFAVEYQTGDEISSGHYLTDVFHPGLQGWLRFNDDHVHVVTSSQVINSNNEKLTPYLLFYRRGD